MWLTSHSNHTKYISASWPGPRPLGPRHRTGWWWYSPHSCQQGWAGHRSRCCHCCSSHNCWGRSQSWQWLCRSRSWGGYSWDQSRTLCWRSFRRKVCQTWHWLWCLTSHTGLGCQESWVGLVGWRAIYHHPKMILNKSNETSVEKFLHLFVVYYLIQSCLEKSSSGRGPQVLTLIFFVQDWGWYLRLCVPLEDDSGPRVAQTEIDKMGDLDQRRNLDYFATGDKQNDVWSWVTTVYKTLKRFNESFLFHLAQNNWKITRQMFWVLSPLSCSIDINK